MGWSENGAVDPFALEQPSARPVSVAASDSCGEAAGGRSFGVVEVAFAVFGHMDVDVEVVGSHSAAELDALVAGTG